MTAYEYDNLPDELNIDALPETMFDEAHAAFTQALESGLLEAKEVKVAYVYDRKGYLTADAFGGQRNAAYGSETDDVVIQMTIRVPNPNNRQAELSKLAALEKTIVEQNLNAERAKLEAEIAAAEQAAQEAQAAAKKKREQLDALRTK
jgi:hypothetical protein